MVEHFLILGSFATMKIRQSKVGSKFCLILNLIPKIAERRNCAKSYHTNYLSLRCKLNTSVLQNESIFCCWCHSLAKNIEAKSQVKKVLLD